MQSLIPATVNLVILVAVLGYYLRKPLVQFVRQRHELLRDELQRVRMQLSQAQAQYKEFSEKLETIESEAQVLRSRTMQDAQEAKERILADAKRSAAAIAADAKTATDTLFSELKGQLYVEMGNRILSRAEVLLKERLTGDDRARIQLEFSRQLEGIQ